MDPFRELFPDLQRYTCRKKTPFKQARLYFFIFSDYMLTNLVNCKIETSYHSDHSMVILELEFIPFVHGKGLWKFNNSLLYDLEYSNIVKNIILEVKKQYGALVYNFENIHEISNDDLHFTINSQLFLETLLMEIRGKTISYSSNKRKERDKIERDLLKDIDTLECNVNQASIQLLENKKQDLENIRKEKIKGKIIRSRVQWIEEGEKTYKIFLWARIKKFY